MTGRSRSPSPTERPLQIAFDARSLCGARTGVGTYTANLLHELLAIDSTLRILLVADQSVPASVGLDPKRVRVFTSASRARNNFFWSNFALSRALREQRPALFHSPGYTVPLWPPRPAVVTLHDVSYAAHPEWYPYRLNAARKLWYRASAQRVDAILTDSEFSRREILRVYGINPAGVFRVYLGVDRATFRRSEEPGRLRDFRGRYRLPDRFILHVGDIHPRRNLDRAVTAFRQVRSSDPQGRELHFVLVGRKLLASDSLGAALQNESDSGIRSLGYVEEDDLPLFYSAAAAFLFPSLYEGFGLSVLEAMACGCPVIVARGTACEEIAGTAAIAVDPRDVAAMAEAVRAILTNQEVAARYSRAGLRRAESFTWRRTAEETLAVYRKVLAAQEPKPPLRHEDAKEEL
jgi:glycosyltransferase involved in cell wall biosynthesis